MVTKRIIPCLDVINGETVKGVNFKDLRYAGNPIDLAKKYSDEGADELVFLDITATGEGRKTTIKMVEKVANQIFIPFTVGGGIRALRDIRALLSAGADKVAINSAAVKKPDLINQAAEYFGSQCVVCAIDAKRFLGEFYVHINSGRINSGRTLSYWISEVQKRGAGEILLTSMDTDGTQYGYDIEMIKLATEKSKIPVIASGGAGNKISHFINVFNEGLADAALAASIFHYNTLPIPILKRELVSRNIEIRI